MGAKRGRKPKLDAATQEKICAALGLGCTLEEACAASDVSVSAVMKWQERGRKARSGPHFQFVQAIKGAKARRIASLLGNVAKAGRQERHWQANVALLERLDPKRFAQRVRVHVEQELTDAIERLCKEFEHEPEVLERALSAITGGASGGEADRPEEDDGGEGGPGGEELHPVPAAPEAGEVSKP